jgi:hypothetical protein
MGALEARHLFSMSHCPPEPTSYASVARHSARPFRRTSPLRPARASRFQVILPAPTGVSSFGGPAFGHSSGNLPLSPHERLFERTDLPKCFVNDDGRRIGEVQGTDRAQRGDTEDGFTMLSHEIFRKTHALSPEDQSIARAERCVEITLMGGGAEETQARGGQGVAEVSKVEMAPNFNQVPIVDARSADGFLVDSKSEGADEVECRCRRRAEPSDVARIGRDLRLDQNDMQWRTSKRRAKSRGLVSSHFS